VLSRLALWLALGQIAAQNPPGFPAPLQRGVQALAGGQLDAAEAAFGEAQRLQPRNSQVYFYLAQVYAQRRQFRQAVVNFREAIRLAPRGLQSYLRLAELYTQLQRFHDAQQTLKELLRVRPDYADAYLLSGRVAQQQGDPTLAERHFRRYLRLRPGNPEGLSQLGATLLAEEKSQQAEPLLQQALHKSPDLAGAHYDLGRLYSRRGEDLQAKFHLDTAVRLLPQSAPACYELGAVLVRLDELAEAERNFRKALDLDPNYPEAYYALGALLRRSGREPEASRVMADYDRLSSAALQHRERTRRVSALFWEVKDLLEHDQLDPAEVKLHQVLELEPENDLAYYRLGQIFYLRHEDERALEAAGVAVERKEFEPAYYMLEAMSLERLGRDEEAEAAYRRLVSLADYADAYLALGRLQLRRGHAAEAVAELRRGLALESGNPGLHLALAEALEKAGNHAESQKQRAQAERLRRKAGPR